MCVIAECLDNCTVWAVPNFCLFVGLQHFLDLVFLGICLGKISFSNLIIMRHSNYVLANK